MKNLGKIKEQLDLNSQDGKILESMRPIMQEKARQHNTASFKSQKKLMMSFCIVCLAIVMLTACLVPSIVIGATRSNQYVVDGDSSLISRRVNFREWFGDSGQIGVYYFDAEIIAGIKPKEYFEYKRRNHEDSTYIQIFNNEKGAEVLKLRIYPKEYFSMEDMRGWGDGVKVHKGVEYISFKNTSIKGLSAYFEYGNYVYNFKYLSETYDRQYVTQLMDILLKL